MHESKNGTMLSVARVLKAESKHYLISPPSPDIILILCLRKLRLNESVSRSVMSNSL